VTTESSQGLPVHVILDLVGGHYQGRGLAAW
jgi:hypothetical protein